MSERTTHRVKRKDRQRIKCGKCHRAPADVCEHVHWNSGNTVGLSFFYYCDGCFAAQKAAEQQRAAEAARALLIWQRQRVKQLRLELELAEKGLASCIAPGV
jgi:hypothetical protein